MKIHKVLNNNVAVVFDEKGREKIVMGRGICFKKKAGEDIKKEEVDKIFSLQASDAQNKLQVLVQDLPMEHIAVGEEIISEAKRRLGRELNDMIYISLIDHVHGAILRLLDGVTVKNALLWDIRRFYKEEFQIGLWALDLVEKKCHVRLPEDEAGFIALHLVNAQMEQKTMENMYEITQVMQEVVNLVKYYFHVDFDEEDVYYLSFYHTSKIFLAKRLVENKTYQEDDNDDLWNIIRKKYEDAYHCVERISKFIEKKIQTSALKGGRALSDDSHRKSHP